MLRRAREARTTKLINVIEKLLLCMLQMTAAPVVAWPRSYRTHWQVHTTLAVALTFCCLGSSVSLTGAVHGCLQYTCGFISSGVIRIQSGVIDLLNLFLKVDGSW